MHKPHQLLATLGAALGLGLLAGCGSIISALDQTPATNAAWTGPQGFDLDVAVPAAAPSGAMDGSGNVLLAWERDVTGANLIWGDAFGATAGWQAPGSFPSATGSAQDVQVAVASSSGVFFCVWDVGTVPTTSQVVLQTWSASGEFGPSKVLSTYPGYAPVLAMNPAGDAVIAWTELLPTNLTAVMAIRYSQGNNGWSAPLQVSTTTTANAFQPLVGLDPTGDVVVLWTEAPDAAAGPYTVQTAHFLASTQAWSVPFSPQVSAADPVSPYGALAMTAGGAQVAWCESTDGSTYQVYSALYAPSTNTWSAPTRVSTAGVDAQTPALGLDTTGNALLAWVQWTQGVTANPAPDLYASTFTVGTGWQAAGPSGVAITTPGLLAPTLSMSPDGYGALAWRQFDGTHWRVAAALKQPGYPWTSPALIQATTGGDASAPTVSIGILDRVVTAWSQTDADGVPHVYANLYQ